MTETKTAFDPTKDNERPPLFVHWVYPAKTIAPWEPQYPRSELSGDRPVEVLRGTPTSEQTDILINDPAVSQRHATFKRIGSTWLLEDHSKNGTSVNGSLLLSRELPVRPGDVLRFGGTVGVLSTATGGFRAIHHFRSGRVLYGGGALDTAVNAAKAFLEDLGKRPHKGRRNGILLQGETGTGKGEMAGLIHEYSLTTPGLSRADKFATMTCGQGQSGDLQVTEIVGHKEGAFTGAVKERDGLLKSANFGTLFIDELHHGTQELWTQLLRILQEGKARPVGSDQEAQYYVQYVAATQIPFSKSAGIPEDLFARFPEKIALPSLRVRREDIMPLIYTFLGDSKTKLAAPFAEAASLFEWPHNVRQLQDVVDRIPRHLAEVLKDPKRRAAVRATGLSSADFAELLQAKSERTDRPDGIAAAEPPGRESAISSGAKASPGVDDLDRQVGAPEIAAHVGRSLKFIERLLAAGCDKVTILKLLTLETEANTIEKLLEAIASVQGGRRKQGEVVEHLNLSNRQTLNRLIAHFGLDWRDLAGISDDELVKHLMNRVR